MLPFDAVLALAASLEGRPDDVAACLHGGLTISWDRNARGGGPWHGDGTAAAPAGPRIVRLPVLTRSGI